MALRKREELGQFSFILRPLHLLNDDFSVSPSVSQICLYLASIFLSLSS
jgi:hypothetical protein